MREKKKLILINPVVKYKKAFAVGQGTQAPLGLGIIAALASDSFNVKIIDEVHQKFELEDADLVGITSYTYNIPRAYEIALLYKAKNIPVVIGGIHASLVSEEAIKYCDSVIIGEVETVWEEFMKDFFATDLKPFYKGIPLDMVNYTSPRNDLFSPLYQSNTVQTSRGCPMDCDFCSVTKFYGGRYRERPVDDILNELKDANDYPLLFFVDDHIVNNTAKSQKRAIRLFKGMVDNGLRRPWFGQGSINFADNPDVLKWAGKSGCYMILTGFESEKETGLASIGKKRNISHGVDEYQSFISTLHKYRIASLGAFIFGLDTDTEQDIIDRYNYILKSNVDVIQISLLTPLPGTSLFEKAKKENRLIYTSFPDDWKHYHFLDVTLKPLNIDAGRLEELMKLVFRGLFSKTALRKRMFKTLFHTRSFTAAYHSYTYNFTYGRLGLEDEIYNNSYDGLNENLEWKNKPRDKYLKRTDWIIALFYKTFWRKYNINNRR